MSKVSIVYHSYQGVTEKMVQALTEGVEQGGGEVACYQAEEADIADLLKTDAFVLACGQPFGTLAGPVKTFLESLWLAEEKEKLEDKPFTFLLNGNNKPQKTAEHLKEIAGYFKWSQTEPEVLTVASEVEEVLPHCRDRGKALAGK